MYDILIKNLKNQKMTEQESFSKYNHYDDYIEREETHPLILIWMIVIFFLTDCWEKIKKIFNGPKQ